VPARGRARGARGSGQSQRLFGFWSWQASRLIRLIQAQPVSMKRDATNWVGRTSLPAGVDGAFYITDRITVEMAILQQLPRPENIN
jgi:hypothetical protein